MADEIPTEPQKSLATKEKGSLRCQVCEFPEIAGNVEGEVDGEQCSLKLCPSCFKYVFLCLRDSYRQDRLFDDDFELEELCGFGKEKKPGLHELFERSVFSAPDADDAKDWEAAKPVGREFGAEDDV